MSSRLAVVAAVTISLAGCGGGEPPASSTTGPSVVSPAGSWSGAINDPISGEGTAQLSLGADERGSLIGTWSVAFRNGDRFSGPAVASLVQTNIYTITLYVDPPPPCAGGSGPGGSALLGFSLINVAVTSNRLTGVAGRLSCSGPSFGTVNLSRQ